MPIDPNIALGVRPVEMPNMLGQMGQMMQLRQAQQGFEEQNALRDAFSQGVDINDPATFKRIAGINPKLAMELRGKDVETQGKQTELGLKRTEYLGAAYGGLVKNPTIDNAYSIFDNAVAMGILPRQVAEGLRAKIAATGGDPRQIAALAQAGVDGAIDAKAKMQDATSRYSTNVAAGTAANRLKFDVDRDTREQEQLKAVLGIVSPERTSSATALPINMGGGGGSGGVPVTPPVGSVQTPPAGVVPVTPPVSAVTPVAGAVGQPNVLATQVTPPPTSVPVPTTVNNLGKGSQKEQLVDQISQLARLPTIAASRALDNKVKEYNILYPTEKIDQDVNGNLITIVNGVAKPVLDAKGLPVQGKPLPETAFNKAVGAKEGEDIVAFVKRVEAAPKNIAKIDEALGILKSGGAVTGFGAETRLNLERAMSLFGNDVKSGKRVVDTQILDALLGSDVFPSLQSLGLGSKNIDTPAEREYLRQVITGTIQLDNDALIRLTQIRRNVETNAIKEYNQKLQGGRLDSYSKAANRKLEKIEVPNPIIRQGRHKNGRLVIERADGTLEYGN
jgi:hypothetical protein